MPDETGNVEIICIDPMSQEITEEWTGDPDGADFDVVKRMINGSMINPSSGNIIIQGYDSHLYQYNYKGNYESDYDRAVNVGRPNGEDLSPDNPLLIKAHNSFISTMSNTIDDRPF